MNSFFRQKLVLAGIIFLLFPHFLMYSNPRGCLIEEQKDPFSVCSTDIESNSMEIESKWTVTAMAGYYFFFDVFVYKTGSFSGLFFGIFSLQIIFALALSLPLSLFLFSLFSRLFKIKNPL